MDTKWLQNQTNNIAYAKGNEEGNGFDETFSITSHKSGDKHGNKTDENTNKAISTAHL